MGAKYFDDKLISVLPQAILQKLYTDDTQDKNPECINRKVFNCQEQQCQYTKIIWGTLH